MCSVITLFFAYRLNIQTLLILRWYAVHRLYRASSRRSASVAPTNLIIVVTVRLLARNVARQPVEAFIQTFTRGGAGRLDEPVTLTKRVKAELVGDLRRAHRVWQILLVGKHQEHRITELIFVQHAVKLITRLGHTITIVAIDNENQTLGVLEVVSPERTNLVLSADVPHRE